jgi:isopropylmalate/homocitrate/citramalate synthase
VSKLVETLPAIEFRQQTNCRRQCITQTAGIHADGDNKKYISMILPERFGRKSNMHLKTSAKANIEKNLQELG